MSATSTGRASSARKPVTRALAQLSIAVPAIGLSVQSAFAPEGHRPPGTGGGQAARLLAANCPTNPHAYGRYTAGYYYSQHSITNPEMSRGVEGIGALYTGPGVASVQPYNGGVGSGVNGVDQEEWLITKPAKDGDSGSWVEGGMRDGQSFGPHHYAAYRFFWAAATQVTNLNNSFMSFGFTAKNASGKAAPAPASNKTFEYKIWEKNSKPSLNSAFDFSLVQSPFNSKHPDAWQAGTTSALAQNHGDYFDIVAGSESSCTVADTNNWWDVCSGSSDGCNGSEGPNFMALTQKVYDRTTSSWAWYTGWQRSQPSTLSSLLSHKSYCSHKVATYWCSTAHSKMFKAASTSTVLGTIWTGEYTG